MLAVSTKFTGIDDIKIIPTSNNLSSMSWIFAGNRYSKAHRIVVAYRRCDQEIEAAETCVSAPTLTGNRV
jgi:hypothetical protein